MPAASPLRLDRAEFVLSDSPEPPADIGGVAAAGVAGQLARFSRPGVSGYGWYRLHLDLPAVPDGPYAAYFPLLESAGALYVNGVYVGQTGAFARGPRARSKRPPSLVPTRSTDLARISAAPVLVAP